MISYILLASASLALKVSAACSRDMLREATAAYIEAQTAGDPTLLPLGCGATYKENDVTMKIAEGVLSQAITIDFNRTIHDTVECAAFAELTAATSKHPYVIHTRMLFTDDSITAIESVVADEGDWAFNATGHLYWTEQETWDPIPEDKRDTREVIQAAGDAYLNQWGNVNLTVPLGTPCARLEGGMYTGQDNLTENTCSMGAFPEPLKVGNRRYIIDEETGAIDIFNNFPWLDAGRTDSDTPSSNMMRVEGGLIRYIHEVTICSIPDCGRL